MYNRHIYVNKASISVATYSRLTQSCTVVGAFSNTEREITKVWIF